MGNTVQQWRACIGGWTGGRIMTGAMKCTGCSSSSPWFKLLVLVALLVIGGIEVNPGPNQGVQSQYKKTTGAADMSGELFETKMLALLFLRGIKGQREFRIASNMAAAGSFDDIVFTLGDRTAFLQLKHRQNKNAKVYMSQLLTVKGDFSLLKYCKSYFDIKDQWQQDQDFQHCGKFEDSLFIVFTNASFVVNVYSNSRNAVLDSLNTQGKLIQFTEQQHPHIYELFRSLPRYKQLLSEVVNGQQVSDTTELLQAVKTVLNNTAKCLPGSKDLVKLLADLKSLGDLSGYTEFLSRLYFCTEQAGVSVLDNLIRSEFNAICGDDALFDKFTIGIQNWWRKSKDYLTVKADFFQDIIQLIAANITKDNSLSKLKFVQKERDIMTQMFRSSNTKIYLKTECTNLSCIKISQRLKTNLLVDVSTLQTHLSEVLASWRLGMCDVLVVEGEITDTSILNKLASMPDPKCVVVISAKAEHALLYQQLKFVSFTDTFCLSQLDAVSQRGVLEHEVMFQGCKVKLNSLAAESFLQTAVTADVLVQLHHTLQIGQQLDVLDPCYLPRTFLRKEFVSEQIFREEHINLAITGISKDRLAQLVPCGEEVQKEKTCKCFLIEGEAEFAALCVNNDHIHWIQAHEGRFLWLSSKGDMSPVIKHLENMNVRYAGADEILAMPHQMVLVVAEPGMGKSTELCKVAHMIKEKEPSTWVIRIDLNQHVNLLSQNQVDAVEFLERVATLNTEFEKRLFEHQLQSGGNVVILVDGVDEVSPNYSHQVIRLLKEFSARKVKQIFVTSRPVMIHELQKSLSILPFSFHQFTPDDQTNFLMRFWKQLTINSFQLSHFISSLLQLVGTSLNDNLKEFTGIPLQCKMLAEVYKDEASHFCQTGQVRLPLTLDILDLYEKFVDKKWEVYFERINVDMNAAFSLVTSHKNMFHQSLMCCALLSYLHDDDIRKLHSSGIVLKQNQDFVEKFNVGQDKTGIVTRIVGNKAVFVHRTFTEYFLAMWCSQNFDTESIIIKKIYLDINFQIVQKFLNRILAKGLKLHTFVLNENLTEVKKLLSMQTPDLYVEDKGGRTALNLAIMNCYYRKDKINKSIVETLLEHGADVNCEDKILPWTPLYLAEQVRAWSVVEKLLEKQADDKDLVWIWENIENEYDKFGAVYESETSVEYLMSKSLMKVMYTALCEGYVHLVKFILKCGVSVKQYITDRYQYKTTMLHIAAEHRQLRLVQLLIQQGADFNISGGGYNRTPLMWAAVRGDVEVVRLLISHEASVNTRDKCGDTALSLAVRKGKNEIVKLLLKHTTYNTNDITAVIWEAGRGDMEATQYLMENNIINSRDKDGYTALLVATKLGNNETAKLLLQKEADVEISGGVFNRTPLMCAAMRCDVEVVQLLISHGASVNTENKYGHTALSLAAREGKHETVKVLLEQGADVDISHGVFNRTPLMWAAKCGHVEVVQLLSAHGASVNTRDKHGDTALSLSARVRKNETVKLLLQKGADVDIPGSVLKRTPLMEAAVRSDVEVAELLISHGASVNTRDKCGDTALSFAARKGKNEIVKLLLKHTTYNTNDITAVIWQAGRGDMEAIQYLIDNKIINSQDKHGYSGLLVATELGNIEVVKLLLQKGADMEVSGGVYKRTPLIYAAVRDDVELVQLFITHGASVNKRDEDGNTALLLAARRGHNNIRQLLLQHGAHY